MSPHLIDQPQLLDELDRVRKFSMKLVSPLETEDFVIQTMADVSPAKWHLAHTTWFFETFVLRPADPNYQSFHPEFNFLFNSYYNAVGKRHARPERGFLSRPTTAEVFAYRESVDQALQQLQLDALAEEILAAIELGIHHEQQHQELMLTDLKHVFSVNPLLPSYRDDLRAGFASSQAENSQPSDINWVELAGGIVSVGHSQTGFHFDNETPRHQVLLQDYSMSHRLVTNAEYLEFIEAKGYQRPELWLSEGWDAVNRWNWEAPSYWKKTDSGWQEFTLGGTRPLRPNSPVTHVSFFEADAFARWRDCRLPTEFEWEVAAAGSSSSVGNFVEEDFLHPVEPNPGQPSTPLQQMFGDVWEWTASPYVAYPGYKPAAGAIGEYNGKFMSSQWVLRGGSCATSRSHIRSTYRNFFHPDKRWQFTGIRLAK